MKRSPMPPRTAPLLSRAPLMRSTALRPESKKRRTDNAHRAVVVFAMREAVAGRCARCRRRDMPVRGHERLGRAQGGDILTPDCLLCDGCNGWCEDNPRLAAWLGWKISSKWPHDHTLEPWQAWALDGSIVDFRVLSLVEAS